VEGGRLSLAKATRLLGVTPSAFAELCDTYGHDLSYEL
jgi:predicted HTH domain antitoxin